MLRSEHSGFRARFDRLFGGCRTAADAVSAPTLHCDLLAGQAGLTYIRFDDPEPLDVIDFALTLFADRGCRELSGSAFAGRALRADADAGGVTIGHSDGVLVVNNAEPWEWLIGNIAVHRALRLQPGVAVLHAASISLRNQGVLLVGAKGTGKTTLSLALAARGHGLLGDEMAALRIDSLELLPLRRSVSIRPGPRSSRVDDAVRAAALSWRSFPDGTSRIHATIDELFPGNTARQVGLTTIVFLRDRRPRPRLEPMAPRREHLRLLPPLRSSLWGVPAAERAMRLLGILPRARCFWLDAGAPDETADLVESAVNGSWD